MAKSCPIPPPSRRAGQQPPHETRHLGRENCAMTEAWTSCRAPRPSPFTCVCFANADDRRRCDQRDGALFHAVVVLGRLGMGFLGEPRIPRPESFLSSLTAPESLTRALGQLGSPSPRPDTEERRHVKSSRQHVSDHSSAAPRHESAVVGGGTEPALNYRGRCT